MEYSSLVKKHLTLQTVSEYYLFHTPFTDKDLADISASSDIQKPAPMEEVKNFAPSYSYKERLERAGIKPKKYN